MGFCRLRVAESRQQYRRAAHKRDQVAASHSMTSSARASTIGGIVNPRALAVLGSMTRLLDLTAATGFCRLNWIGHWTATRAVCVWAPLGSSAPASAKRIIRSLRILSGLPG